ncbi:MAG: MFS transporter [Chloroflexota bacterium]
MSRQPSSLRLARWAVLVMFFANGALLASWLSRIPQIQANLTMSEGQLGLALMGLAGGVLVALSMSGGLISRFGSRAVTAGGGVLVCLLLPFLSMMPNAVALGVNLFLFGAAMSVMDVAMNSQGVDVERGLGHSLMSSFHAAFSIGGFTGAAIGAVMAYLEVGLGLHFIIVGVAFLLLILLAAPRLLSVSMEVGASPSVSVFQLPARALWPLGAVAFCSSIGEGAMADWSAVYLKSVVGTTDSLAAFGFAAFSITMTVGRLLGDNLAMRFGGVTLVRAGGLTASAGLLLAILLPQTGTVLLGFAAVGAGLSIVVPLAFSAAGNVPNLPAGVGIAGVATIGYAGLLAGPPIIGLLAEATTLRVAMVLVLLLVGSLIFTSSVLRTELN